MSKITVEVETAVVKQALGKLSGVMQNLQKPLAAVGEDLIASHRERFETKLSPEGVRWEDNSPLTQLLKGGNNPLVGESKSLQRQFSYNVGAHRLEFGSTMQYAAVQHFGAERGSLANKPYKSKSGTYAVPWGDIPARPFLGLSSSDVENMLQVVEEYFTDAMR